MRLWVYGCRPSEMARYDGRWYVWTETDCWVHDLNIHRFRARGIATAIEYNYWLERMWRRIFGACPPFTKS